MVKFQDRDQKKFKAELKARLSEIKHMFKFYQVWLDKNIERKNFLEGLYYYHEYAMQPLVEILRIKYRDYYMKGIYHDLPKRYVSIIESLFKVRSLKEILTKTKLMNRLFEESI